MTRYLQSSSAATSENPANQPANTVISSNTARSNSHGLNLRCIAMTIQALYKCNRNSAERFTLALIR